MTSQTIKQQEQKFLENELIQGSQEQQTRPASLQNIYCQQNDQLTQQMQDQNNNNTNTIGNTDISYFYNIENTPEGEDLGFIIEQETPQENIIVTSQNNNVNQNIELEENSQQQEQDQKNEIQMKDKGFLEPPIETPYPENQLYIRLNISSIEKSIQNIKQQKQQQEQNIVENMDEEEEEQDDDDGYFYEKYYHKKKNQNKMSNQMEEEQQEDCDEKDQYIYSSQDYEEEEEGKDNSMGKDQLLYYLIYQIQEDNNVKDEQLQQLNDQQYQQIVGLLQQKKLGVKEFQYQQSDEQIQSQKAQKSKRVEEKQKFIFKKVFKQIENNYFKSRTTKKRIPKQSKDYTSFYSHYFKKTATKKKVAIENFYTPQKNTSNRSKVYKNIEKLQSTQKTFNQAYIDLILASEIFRKEAENYLNQQFIKDMQKERTQKIDKFIKKCKQIIQEKKIKVQKQYTKKLTEYETSQLINEELKDYILYNRQCKVPWTKREIQDVKDYGISYIQSYTQKLNME